MEHMYNMEHMHVQYGEHILYRPLKCTKWHAKGGCMLKIYYVSLTTISPLPIGWGVHLVKGSLDVLTPAAQPLAGFAAPKFCGNALILILVAIESQYYYIYYY